MSSGNGVLTFKQPATGIGYGPSGTGKTTDLLYTFATRGFYIAVPAALKPSVNVVGIDLNPSHVYEAKNIADATAKVKEVAKLKDTKGLPLFDAVIADDFTFLAEQSFSLLEKKFSGFKLFGALRDEVIDFRDASRNAFMHLFVNAHESAPATKNGAFIRGGPKLPGRLPEEFPAAFDLVLRAAYDTSRAGWPAIYRCSPNDTAYISRDRHGVTPEIAPMNMGEILRAAGYTLRRAPGMEWMDAVADKIAGYLLATPQDEKAILTEVTRHILQAHYPAIWAEPKANPVLTGRAFAHVRWCIRDGRDRALLRAAMGNPLLAYGVNVKDL
jgi:hypothetical protein